MMLQLQDLDLYRHRQRLLQQIRWQLPAGQILVVLGENGCGKTSLLHALAEAEPRHLHWQRGLPVWPVGVVLSGFRSLARQHIPLIPGLAVRDVLTLVQPDPQQVLEAWGLMELAGRRCSILSSGQLQRLEIARSEAQLRGGPGVWLLDEPFSMLDVRWQQVLLQRLKQHCQQGGSVILSLHNLTLTRQCADQVVLLGQGQQLAQGAVELLEDGELLQRVYGAVPFDAAFSAQ